MPPSATSHALSWGVNRGQVVGLQYGQVHEVKELQVEATPARHVAGIPGWEVPDAMGVLVRAENLQSITAAIRNTTYELGG